jgi:hypothetical protein
VRTFTNAGLDFLVIENWLLPAAHVAWMRARPAKQDERFVNSGVRRLITAQNGSV